VKVKRWLSVLNFGLNGVDDLTDGLDFAFVEHLLGECLQELFAVQGLEKRKQAGNEVLGVVFRDALNRVVPNERNGVGLKRHPCPKKGVRDSDGAQRDPSRRSGFIASQ